jgi:hypothetical protein
MKNVVDCSWLQQIDDGAAACNDLKKKRVDILAKIHEKSPRYRKKAGAAGEVGSKKAPPANLPSKAGDTNGCRGDAIRSLDTVGSG